MKFITPPALTKGDLIGIIAPSSVTHQKSIAPGIRMLERAGFDVAVHPQTFKTRKSSAGTRTQKLAALNDFIFNDDIRAVIAARGGNHALDLLDGVDYAAIRKHPKIYMGFSDTTALLNAIAARSALVTIHGPVLSWLSKVKDPDLVFAMLAGKKVALPMQTARGLTGGTVTGRLVGGNLAVFAALLGTPYLPKLDGAILFLEDINEELSHLDRVFTRLRLAGVFDKIGGVVLGQFTGCKDSGQTPYGFTFADLVAHHFSGLAIPVAVNAPFGHGSTLFPLPVGGMARLNIRGKTVSLTLTEPAAEK